MGQKARVDLVLDCADPLSLVSFWRDALDYREYFVDESLAVLVPKDGNASPLVLQGVPEPKAGKNRMHLDVHPPLELGVPALVERLEALGGRRIGEPVTDLLEAIDSWWQVMADPEGNEFCVVADQGHPPPA